jgi:hypothetical protein
MADEVVEVPLDKIEDQAEYVKARTEGRQSSEVPVEKPEEEAPEAKPEATDAKEEQHKSKNGAQKKIDRLIKLNAEREKEVEGLRRDLEEIRKGVDKKDLPKVREGEPKQEDYTDYEEYLIDKAAYRLDQKQKVQRELEERKSEEAKNKEQFDSHNERVIAARAKYEDFDEVVAVRTPWMDGTKADIAASQAFQVAVFEEPNSAEILYYLGSNPEELAKFAGLSPAQVVKMVGRIADKVTIDEPAIETAEETEVETAEAEEKPKRQPPTPIRPVTGASRNSVPLSKIDDQRAYVKARMQGRTR